MALSTPLLYSIASFDAHEAHTILFTVSGGDRVIANRLIVKKNSNLSVLYNDVVESYSFSHVIPADTLANGEYYVAQIKTYGVNDDITDENAGSPWSNSVPFYCYSSPTLIWENKPYDSVIQTSNFVFQFSYNQSEGEQLYSYIINLYNQTQQLIGTSNIKYVSGNTPLSYFISGLLDDNTYYIEINGVTVNNTQISSGKILFYVNYYEPDSTQIFDAKNDSCNGWITISNTPYVIEATSYPSPPNYVKNDTAVDIRDDGYYVTWNGFSQAGDFCIRIWGYDFGSDKMIFTAGQNTVTYNIALFRRDGYEYDSNVLQTYYELQVYNETVFRYMSQPYFIYSNYINQPSENDKVFICIKRIKNIYSLYIENLG